MGFSLKFCVVWFLVLFPTQVEPLNRDTFSGSKIWWNNHCFMEFNASTERHANMVIRLFTRFVGSSDQFSIDDHYILGKQFLFKRPTKWIFVLLSGAKRVGEDGREEVVLALRSDNGYLIGFATSSGRWFVFKGNKRFIPTATELEFGDKYPEILRTVGGFQHVPMMFFGKDALEDAVRVLSRYDPATSDDSEFRLAVATVLIMICEAVRIEVIGNEIESGWEKGTQLSLRAIDLIHKWKDVSCAVLISYNQGGKWDSAEAVMLKLKFNMQNQGDALKVLNLILWPSLRRDDLNPCSSPVMQPRDIHELSKERLAKRRPVNMLCGNLPRN